MLAVVDQIGNNFHCYFSQIKKFIVRLLVSFNRDFKKLFLYLFELIFSIFHTQLSYLLESIRFTWFFIVLSDHFKYFRYFGDIVRVISIHFFVKNILVLFFQIDYLSLNSIDKFMHVVNFALHREITQQILMDLFGLITKSIW